MTPLQNAAIGILAAALSVSLGAAQERLSARELFYSPVAAAASKPPSATRAKPTASAGKSTRPSRQNAEVRREPDRRVSDPPQRAESRPVEGKIVPVSHSSKPLALRYSVMKLSDDGRYQEVDAASTFRSGDRIRIALQVNDDGYLYVVHQGSSGVWKALFPSTEVDHGSNRVQPERTYDIPPSGRFYFDEQAGVEKLFLVVARRPVDDLDSLIYSVRPGSAPGKPTRERSEPALMAQNMRPIDNGLIQRIRSDVMARDLVFEKVDEQTPGERREKAVYAAVVEGGDAAQVVADIELRHQ